MYQKIKIYKKVKKIFDHLKIPKNYFKDFFAHYTFSICTFISKISAFFGFKSPYFRYESWLWKSCICLSFTIWFYLVCLSFLFVIWTFGFWPLPRKSHSNFFSGTSFRSWTFRNYIATIRYEIEPSFGYLSRFEIKSMLAILTFILIVCCLLLSELSILIRGLFVRCVTLFAYNIHVLENTNVRHRCSSLILS